jgi:hypothetical protein
LAAVRWWRQRDSTMLAAVWRRHCGGGSISGGGGSVRRRTARQWLVACRKSNDRTTMARRYMFMKRSEKEKLTSYLELKKIQ